MRFYLSLLILINVLADLAFAQVETTVPAGTRIHARLETAVRTSTSEVGDRVTAIVNNNVRAGDKVLVPKGSRLSGRVETVQSGTPQVAGHVRLVFREIELPDGRHLSTWITNSFGAAGPHRNARYALLMGIGGVAGGLIGGKRARTAGILGGLLAGFVIAGSRASSSRDLTLKAGQDIRLLLGEDLELRNEKLGTETLTFWGRRPNSCTSEFGLRPQKVSVSVPNFSFFGCVSSYT